jgi:nitrilase
LCRSTATDAIGDAARKAGVVVSIGVNECDGGSLYNTQLLYDADGALIRMFPLFGEHGPGVTG